jgi:hypothetical protein
MRGNLCREDAIDAIVQKFFPGCKISSREASHHGFSRRSAESKELENEGTQVKNI